MMNVAELSRNQLIELKQAYLTENQDTVYMSELAFADELVSDETIFEEYAGYEFSEDDFTC